MATGMDRETGKPIDGFEHLKQSIADILSTRIGSRVERRNYGAAVPFLVDRPMNNETLVDLYAETATALRRWEPRLKVTRVWISEASEQGNLTLNVRGVYLPSGQEIRLDGIVVT